MMLGSQSAMAGNMIINIIAIRSQPKNGSAALEQSPSVVPFGATPFITNKQKP